MKLPHLQPPVAEPMSLALPRWIGPRAAETHETAAFQSGAALAHLAMIATAEELPHALWRDRLALLAAETCSIHLGRRDGARALRDALYLTRPGDDPGPAGKILWQWSRAAARPLSVTGLAKPLEGISPERITQCLGATGPSPVHRAAQVIEAVLADLPRGETAALILADAVLAKSLGWDRLFPLLSLGLKTRDLRLRGDELRLACHQAICVGVGQALPLATELSRAALRLRAVAPKLRAKAAARAVDLFLSRDALAPSALDFMSDRAARRLCDRLVELGALRELTGRDTFRLYGL